MAKAKDIKAKVAKAVKAPEVKVAETKAAEAKKAKDTKEKDAYGFRLGTKRQLVMEMLGKGEFTAKEIAVKLAPFTTAEVKSVASLAGKTVVEDEKSGRVRI